MVGGGIAGLRAALEAAVAGDRVLLVDERSWLGGTATTGDVVDGEPALPWIATTGGPDDRPCQPRGAHGFFMQDGPAISAIVGFIRSR